MPPILRAFSEIISSIQIILTIVQRTSVKIQKISSFQAHSKFSNSRIAFWLCYRVYFPNWWVWSFQENASKRKCFWLPLLVIIETIAGTRLVCVLIFLMIIQWEFNSFRRRLFVDTSRRSARWFSARFLLNLLDDFCQIDSCFIAVRHRLHWSNSIELTLCSNNLLQVLLPQTVQHIVWVPGRSFLRLLRQIDSIY